MYPEYDAYADIAYRDIRGSDLYLIRCGRREHARRHVYVNNTQSLVLSYVESGATDYAVNGRVFPLGAGMLYVVFPGADTRYSAAGTDWTIRWVVLGGTDCPRLLDLLGLSPEHPVLRPADGRQVCDILKKLFLLSQDTRYETKIECKLLFYTLLSLLLRDRGGTAAPADYVGYVDRMIRYHYADRITVAEIAGGLHLDRSYLSRLYREKTGTTIKRRLLDIQLRAAETQLEAGRTVTEAACAAGFSDPLYFSKVYKKVFGHPPGKRT